MSELSKAITGRRRTKKKYTSIQPNPGHSNVTKEVYVCPSLAQIVRGRWLSRGQIIKRVWIYIKAKRLQSPGRGRFIIPDERLAAVVGSRGVEMNAFILVRELEKHIVKGKIKLTANA